MPGTRGMRAVGEWEGEGEGGRQKAVVKMRIEGFERSVQYGARDLHRLLPPGVRALPNLDPDALRRWGSRRPKHKPRTDSTPRDTADAAPAARRALASRMVRAARVPPRTPSGMCRPVRTA